MQQWEDWRAGYDWRVWFEKTALTLLVVSLSYYGWQFWAATRREAALHYNVPIPSRLTETARRESDEHIKRVGPSEEVSTHQRNIPDTTNGRADL